MGDPSNLVLGWRTSMMIMVCLPIVIASLLLFLKNVEQEPSRYLASIKDHYTDPFFSLF